MPDRARAIPTSTAANPPLKKTASLGGKADLKRTSSDTAKANAQVGKQLPKATFKSHLKLDLKSKGLS